MPLTSDPKQEEKTAPGKAWPGVADEEGTRIDEISAYLKDEGNQVSHCWGKKLHTEKGRNLKCTLWGNSVGVSVRTCGL